MLKFLFVTLIIISFIAIIFLIRKKNKQQSIQVFSFKYFIGDHNIHSTNVQNKSFIHTINDFFEKNSNNFGDDHNDDSGDNGDDDSE
ncbi:hypothetical protein ACQKP0_13920 [Heyndrickxia sp. NPDC080065]|uniref:hypothetical protein n=1 Tax=Heyndrickxia sp. NPDC080065 TaxID=3390568 RepID=UPI003D05226B